MIGLVIIGAFLVALFWVTRQQPGDHNPWVIAARKLRLTAKPDGITGVYRGVPVKVNVAPERIHFEIGPVDKLASDFELTAIGADGVSAEDAERKVPTGDAVFDRRVAVYGPRPVVTAVMDWETRQRISTTVRDLDLSVRSQILTAELRGTEHEAGLLAGYVTALVALARRLRFRDDTAAERYFDNAGEDPKAQVRLRNLEALVERHPDSVLAKEALRRAKTDPDARIRAVGD